MTKMLPTGGNKQANSRGFSLIELLVVLTLMTVVASSISYVVLNPKDGLKKSVDQLVLQLRFMQQYAVRDAQPKQVEFHLAENRIEFLEQDLSLPNDVSMTIKTAERQVVNADTVGITFYPDNTSSGGVVTLENDKEVYDVSIVWISGKILKHKRMIDG